MQIVNIPDTQIVEEITELNIPVSQIVEEIGELNIPVTQIVEEIGEVNIPVTQIVEVGVVRRCEMCKKTSVFFHILWRGHFLIKSAQNRHDIFLFWAPTPYYDS